MSTNTLPRERIHQQAGLMQELGPYQITSFSPEVSYTDMPQLAAVIQTSNMNNLDASHRAHQPVDRLMVVDMRGVPESREHKGFKKFEGEYITNDADYLLIDPINLDFTKDRGYKALRRGERFVYGRPTDDLPPGDKRRRFLGADSGTSRTHFEIGVDPQGVVTVMDAKSTNGTTVFTGEHAEESLRSSERALKFQLQAPRLGNKVLESLITKPEPNYANARAMHPDELWAKKNNGGRPQDERYIAHYQHARQRLVDTFKAGKLYESQGSFEQVIKGIHKFLGDTGDYNRLNPDAAFKSGDSGVFDEIPGRAHNGRYRQAREASDIAQEYGDPYGADDRLRHGAPNGKSVSAVKLPGIDPNNLPYDVVRYDENGDAKPMDYEDLTSEESGYVFFYPDSRGREQYMTQIYKLGQSIDHAITSGASSPDQILKMIAQQYQYAAIARPFKQINNSLFMQLANMQVKLLGYKGMTHGEMDIVAQRMQPDAFARYFADRVKGFRE